MISGGLNGGANPFIMKIRDAIESGSVDCMYFAAIFKEYIVSEVMLQVLMYMTFATPLDLLVGVAAISIIVACFLYSCVITYAYLDYILEDDDNLSKDITQGLNNGKTIKLLAEVTPEGNVEYKILDSEGKETGPKWP